MDLEFRHLNFILCNFTVLFSPTLSRGADGQHKYRCNSILLLRRNQNGGAGSLYFLLCVADAWCNKLTVSEGYYRYNDVAGRWYIDVYKLYTYMHTLHKYICIVVFTRVCWIAKSNYQLRQVCVCLSVRTEQLVFHWKYLYEIWYLSIFRKYVENNQVC
jgi:hypothetical protein